MSGVDFMIIGCDLDGTLQNIQHVWIDYLNKKHGLNKTYEDITKWDMRYAFPDLTKDQIYEPLYSDSFWYDLKPLEYAQEYLKKLYDTYKVYIVTSSYSQTIDTKITWMKEYFPFIEWRDVIVMKNKQMLKLDVLIDDGPHNLIGGSYKKYLIDAPYNRDVEDYKLGIVRVKNLKDVWEDLIQ
jgi:5'(3')-deoxyribonucleotidase